MVQWPDNYVRPEELHLHYRTGLKKRGIRVVPSTVRLRILRDLISLLQKQPSLQWRQIVNTLSDRYLQLEEDAISKSLINDVLRIARRADVIAVANGNGLTTAPVHLRLEGDRLFQHAVVRCDVTYLKEIQNLSEPFDIEQASLALYEGVAHSRYLKVILHRFSNNGTPPS